MADDELLDAICSSDLSNQLDNLWVLVTSVTSDDNGGVLNTLWNGQQNAGNERLGIVSLLETDDLLAKTRSSWLLILKWLELDCFDVCHCECVCDVMWWYGFCWEGGMRSYISRRQDCLFAWNPTFLCSTSLLEAGEGSRGQQRVAWTSWRAVHGINRHNQVQLQLSTLLRGISLGGVLRIE